MNPEKSYLTFDFLLEGLSYQAIEWYHYILGHLIFINLQAALILFSISIILLDGLKHSLYPVNPERR